MPDSGTALEVRAVVRDAVFVGLAHQRAVSRGGSVLRRGGFIGVCRGGKRMVEKRYSGFRVYDGWRNALHEIDMLTGCCSLGLLSYFWLANTFD